MRGRRVVPGRQASGLLLAAALLLSGACGGGISTGGTTGPAIDGGGTSGSGGDGGSGVGPGGGSDAGGGGGAGGGPDAGGGGADGGSPKTDGGTDGGQSACATPPCYDSSGAIAFGSPGPWPVDNEQFGAAQGIQETPIVAVTTDEAQNLWVATHAAIYLLKPGRSTFVRFDGKDGLHTGDNPALYCDTWAPGGECPIYGKADAPGIISLVGGGPNEVFVGYQSYDDWNLRDAAGNYIEGTWQDPQRHDGKVDRVRLSTTGTLLVDRFDFVSYNSVLYWHDRSALRMIFDHFIHPHELYVGTEHGIDRVQPDKFSMPAQNSRGQYASWFLPSTYAWLGDHLHPRVCYHQYCSGDENRGDSQRMGDWFGLALDARGDLWVGGRWSAGKIFWTQDNVSKDANGNYLVNGPGAVGWPQRGGNAYTDPVTGRSFTFGDPWCGSSGQTSIYDASYTDPATGSHFRPTSCSPYSGIPPVFPVPEEGDIAAIVAVSVAPDGRVWWAGAPFNGGDPSYGLAVNTPPSASFSYISPSSFGMNDNVRDLVALPDGRIALGGDSTGLWLLNPATMTATNIAAGNGIPGNRVLRLELDTMVSPAALHVATNGGAAVLRKLP